MLRLLQHVRPVEAVGPQLRVLPRDVDRPKRGQSEHVAAREDADHEDRAVHEQVRGQLAAERDDRRGEPARLILCGRDVDIVARRRLLVQRI